LSVLAQLRDIGWVYGADPLLSADWLAARAAALAGKCVAKGGALKIGRISVNLAGGTNVHFDRLSGGFAA